MIEAEDVPRYVSASDIDRANSLDLKNLSLKSIKRLYRILAAELYACQRILKEK